MYKVLIRFEDRTDGHIYNPGDCYPRKGRNASGERIEELLSSDNAFGRPIVGEVEEEQPVEEKKRHKKGE